MAEQEETIVRGRCACGRRFRIRNAQAGLTVTCPNCQRPITLTRADLVAAAADQPLIPLQPEHAEPLDAILVDDAELRPAAAGSRPGLTGQQMHAHDEALLARALNVGLRPSMTSTTPAADRPTDDAKKAATPESRPRTFLADLVGSFVFAGDTKSAATFLATVGACAVPVMLGYFLASALPWMLTWLVNLLATGYLIIFPIPFAWQTLTRTARGEDDLPMIGTEWDLWEGVLKPLVWMALITVLCAGPALALHWYLPATYPSRLWILGGALALGSLFWPVALMSVALGEALVFVRPDWLIRCILGIGPVYVIAWLQCLLVAAGLVIVYATDLMHMGGGLLDTFAFPPAFATAALYCGYVLFRTLGLLFRHYRHRFPWKF